MKRCCENCANFDENRCMYGINASLECIETGYSCFLPDSNIEAINLIKDYELKKGGLRDEN